MDLDVPSRKQIFDAFGYKWFTTSREEVLAVAVNVLSDMTQYFKDDEQQVKDHASLAIRPHQFTAKHILTSPPSSPSPCLSTLLACVHFPPKISFFSFLVF